MKRVLIWLLLLSSLPLWSGERVVSLSPAVTELLLYAGGREYICARSRVCENPQIAHLPVAGELGMPITEAVLKNRATLVISDISHPGANWQMLRRCGVKTEILPAEKLSDLPQNVRRIGKLLKLDGAEKRAAALASEIAGLQKSKPEKPLKAAVFFSLSPLVSCGRNSFITEALRLAGVENPASAAGKSYFILSAEYLCRLSPEIIILIGVNEKAAAEFFRRPVFQGIPAVKMRNIIILDADRWGRLTPEMISNIRELRKQLAVRQKK